ncbi:protein kinase [Catenulispora yoronensis]
MGRSESPIIAHGPLADFASGLRELRDTAGRPTYKELGERTNYAPTALSTAANGKKLPSWDVTVAFVRACGGDEQSWLTRWDEVRRSMSAEGALPVPRTTRSSIERRFARAEPAGAQDVSEFVAQMRRLRIEAGKPTLSELDRRAREAGRRLPTSTLSDALKGGRLPSWPVVHAFVLACGGSSGIDDWEDAWKRVAMAEDCADSQTGLYSDRRPKSGPRNQVPIPPYPAPPTADPPTGPRSYSPAAMEPEGVVVAGGAPASLKFAVRSHVDGPRVGDPSRVGPYKILGRIGSGGMGVVYLAESPGRRRVAVKCIHSDLAANAEFRRRFAQEVDAARRVGGFHAVQVIDADPSGDPPWLATAYIPGPSLADAISQVGPMSEPALRLLGAGLAEALVAIHAAGLAHRDLKPSNVLLADDGPRVIDFGVSRAFNDGSLRTATGVVIGTPQFMAPEQIIGSESGAAGDVFSLGLVLCEAAGCAPFGNGSAQSLLLRAIHTEPDLAAVPPGMRRMIAACLQKDPTRRPTPSELIAQWGTDSLAETPDPRHWWPIPQEDAVTMNQPPLLPRSPRSTPPR